MNREKKPIDQGEIASGMVLFGLAGFIFTVILDASGEVIGIEQLVKTKIITEDKRRTELVYKKSRGKIKTLIFRHDAYETFKELIPSKER